MPSHDKRYKLSDIEEALENAHGAKVTVRCHRGALNEIWYHYNVAGRLQNGAFKPADAGTFIADIYSIPKKEKEKKKKGEKLRTLI